MLKPSALVDAVVVALQSNQDLVAEMLGDPTRIYAHHYLYGTENKLAEALYKMAAPNILVVWEGTVGGDFNGMTIWKHKVSCYIRATNAAKAVTPSSYENIWHAMVNKPVLGGQQNLRQIQLTGIELPPGSVDLMDTPSIDHLTDEEGMDYFVARFVFPEIGDN